VHTFDFQRKYDIIYLFWISDYLFFTKYGKNTFISGKDITQLVLHCYTHIQWESRGTQEWLRLDQF